jgi:hypothetical protein
MKKVSLLILLVIVLSTVMMAAVPTKMVRLTIINKSGYDVFMKLTGSAVTDAFYYLTVPTGDADNPEVKVFTVMSDVYDRETWQCNGVRSAGQLIVAGNIRLVFVPCGRVQMLCRYYYDFDGNGVAGLIGTDNCNRTAFVPDLDWDAILTSRTWRPAGEPRMEKVTYFQFLRWTGGNFPRDLVGNWDDFNLYGGAWSAGCATFFWRSYTWRTPLGCEWSYQY